MLHHDSSSIELLGSLENEFTPHQIANFKQAFGVFDVNKDGRISTNEIFEVLQTMGNEVSSERQNKIRNAVASVDLDRSGDLDFAEFIQFMKIMDEHNKTEASELRISPDKSRIEDRATWRYFKLYDIKIRLRASTNWIMWAICWIFVLYNLAHSIFMQVLIGAEWNILDLNPQRNTDINEYAWYILIIRYVNFANYFLVILLLLNEHSISGIFDALQYAGCKRTPGNLIRYLVRPIFVLNTAADVLFILGIHDPVWIEPSTSAIEFYWERLAPPFAQIASNYFLMSFFFYYETFVEPASIFSRVLTFVTDMLLCNWMRMIFTILKNAAALLLLPVFMIFSLLYLITFKCSPGCFLPADPRSKTSRLIHLMCWLAG